MKGNFAINIFSRLCRGARSPAIVALAGFLLLALLACEQPFRAGLGTLVDAERPGVSLARPSGGSFLRGDEQGRVVFAGASWDDLRVEAVQLSYRQGLDEPEDEDWQDVDALTSPRRDGGRIFRDWEHSINVGVLRDGELRVRLRVSDGIERDGSLWEYKDETVFLVRNSPPAITLTLPLVADDLLGSVDDPLNYGFLNPPPYGGIAYIGNRRVDGEVGMIVGIIRDDRGVNLVRNAAAGLYPPRFRLWEITDAESPPDGIPGIPQVQLRDLTEAWVEGQRWWNFGDVLLPPSDLIPLSLTNVQFFFNFPDYARGRNFAIQISAQSVPVRFCAQGGDSANCDPDCDYCADHFDSFLFPRDEWSDVTWDALEANRRLENSFVAFFIMPPQEPPALELLQFQNISDYYAWNDDRGDYNDMPGYSEDDAHPFITDLAFNAKSGAFTLRVRTSHEDGISHAMAFWEGGGNRGRFIWDPVAYQGLPFSRWGASDRRKQVVNDYGESVPNSVRNFVFTYGGGVAGRVPDVAGYNAGVRGRYRIQRFIGGDEAWRRLYDGIHAPAGWNAFYDSRCDLWADDEWDANTEGVFTIWVYARTPAGTANTVPLVTFLTLDRAQPTLELTRLDGSAGETTVDGRLAHIVNGVIRPMIFASDARASDSGHRASGGFFARPNGLAAEEVMFLLIHDRDRDTLDAHMGHPRYNFWPLPSAAGAGAVPTLPGSITVYRHGPIHDGSMYIQTTRSHASNRYDPLPDGTYWLYVFSRDRAFNVGRESFPLVVRADSDLPEFDFSIGLINRDPVTDPNQSADGTPAGFRAPGTIVNGVYVPGPARNVLRPTTDIRFRIRDDDGLDLGVQGGAATSMSITFTGSFVNAAGEVRPLADYRHANYLITLTDQQAKAIFSPRATADSPVPREREGTIQQSLLLDLLRASPRYRALFGDALNGNSLPGGLYRMIISVSDDPNSKLSMPLLDSSGYEPVDRATGRVEFWIAVDNEPPRVYPSVAYIYPPDERRVMLPPPEHYQAGYFAISSQIHEDGRRVGILRDDNGPLRVTGFTVSVTEATPPEFEGSSVDVLRESRLSSGPGFIGAPRDWVTLNRHEDVQDVWEYWFEAWVNLNRFFPGIEAGNFRFTLTVSDRFDNPLSIVRQHQEDEVSPTVMLTREVETFTRPSLGPEIGVINAGTATVRGRLANSVISFSAHAWDNFTVYGLRWWLLPAGTGASGVSFALPGGLTDYGVVDSFNSYPALSDEGQAAESGRAIPIADAASSVVGAFGWLDAPGGTVYIDTRGMGLPDGEYVLHLIARDAHGNDSLDYTGTQHPRIAQRIFLYQDQDKPYFDAGILPVAGNVRGEHGLWVTGIIMDDDGFGRDTLEDGSVRMWVSRTRPLDPMTGEPVEDLEDWEPEDLDNWAGSVYRDLTVADGLTRSGRDIVLNIGLLEVFGRDDILFVRNQTAYDVYPIGHPNRHPTRPGLVRRDGTIYYVIRARDSVSSKIQGPFVAGVPAYPQQQMSRYRAFSFTVDSLPPEIILSDPFPWSYAWERIFREDFRLVGSVSDVHLPTMPEPDGRPYILWSLNGATPPARFPLPSEIEPIPGRQEQIAEIDIYMSDLLSGSHDPPVWVAGFADIFTNPDRDGEYVLELSVVDGIGQAAVITLNFTIDRHPPVVGVNFPGGQAARDAARMTQNEFDRWHGVLNTPNHMNYEDRRAWAAERTLPIIFHDGTADPILSGSIVDEFSDIFPLDANGNPEVTFTLNRRPQPHEVVWVGEGRNWRWEIDLGGLPDGVNTLTITGVGDRAGNNAPTEHFAFRMDSDEPRLSLNAQPMRLRVLGAAESFPAGQPVLTIGGTATDTNLRDVRITLRGENADLATYVVRDEVPGHVWVWDDDDELWVLYWSFGLSETVYRTLVPGQTYEIVVVAHDWREHGGNSEPAVWTFTKDPYQPEIGFGTEDGFVFIGDSQTIHGTVADEHSDIRSVQSRIQRQSWIRNAADEWVVDWENVFAEPGDADGWREIRADGAGNGGNLTGSLRNRIWRTPALGVPVAEGGLGLADGLYRIQIRAMDSSWFTAAGDDWFDTDDDGSFYRANWLGTDGDGNFLPTAAGNPYESGWLFFHLDRAPPELSLDAQPERTRVLGPPAEFGDNDDTVLTMRGEASDATLRGVRLTLRRPGFSRAAFILRDESYLLPGEASSLNGSVRSTWEWDGAGWNLEWEFDLNRGVYEGLAAGETYEIEVVSLDWRTGGISAPGVWTFTKDPDSPEIGFGTANNMVFIGESQTIHGTVADEHSDIRSVQSRIERSYWVQEDGQWVERWAPVFAAPGDADGWREIRADGSGNGGSLTGGPRNRIWRTPALGNADGGLDLADGLYRIRIRAMDSSWFTAAGPNWFNDDTDWFGDNAAGNPVETYPPLYFRLDRAAPSLYLAEQPEHTRVLGPPAEFYDDTAAVLTMSGTARDATLRGVRLTLRRPGFERTAFIIRDESQRLDGEVSDLDGDAHATWEWDSHWNDDRDRYEYAWNMVWRFYLGHDVYSNLVAGETYEIEVVSLDWRTPGTSGPDVWTFTKDTSRPSIYFLSETTHSNAPPEGPTNLGFTPGMPGALEFRGAGQTIHGTVTDDSAVRTVEFRIRTWNWDADHSEGGVWTYGDWGPIDLSGSASNRIWRTPALGVPAGDGGLGLVEGLYGLQIRATDYSWTGEFDNDVAVMFGNPVESEWLYFYFDNVSPVLRFHVNPPQNMSSRFGTGTSGVEVFDDGGLGFHVFASDSNRIASITLRIENAASEMVNTRTWDDLGFGQSLTEIFDIAIPLADGQPRNGMHTAIVTAYDFSGNRSEIRRGFGLDNTSPGGTFSTPDVGEALGGEARVSISGETFDTGEVESGPARAWFRFGLLGNEFPDADALVAHYTSATTAAANDTARNDASFGNAESWFEMTNDEDELADLNYILEEYGLRVTRGILHSWEMQADTVDLLDFARKTDWRGVARISLPSGDDGFLEMPIWFRVVDGAGNAGYFHRVIRINPDADRPVNRIETPADRVGPRDSPRGGAVTFDGFAEVAMPGVYVSHVLYRVWVGRPRPAPTTPIPDGFVLWHDPDPDLQPADRTYYFLRVATPDDLLGLATVDTTVAGVQARLEYHDLWETGEQYWFPAATEPAGGITTWNFLLNADGEITDLMNTVGTRPGMGFVSSTGLPAPPDAENDMLFVMVETIALNNRDERKMSIGGTGDGGTFDDPVPNRRMFYLRLSAPMIDVTRVVGINAVGRNSEGTDHDNPHRGTFRITADLDATYGMEISEIRIVRPDELPGAGTNQSVNLTAASTGVDGLTLEWLDGGRQRARIVYTLDSMRLAAEQSPDFGRIRDGQWANSGGEYRVEIRVRDDMTPPSETTLTLTMFIDNFAPIADESYNTPGTRAGAWESFQGRVLDGSVSLGTPPTTIDRNHVGARIDRVYAWFESRVNSTTTPRFIAHTGPFDGNDTGTMPIATTGPMFHDVWTGRTATVDGMTISNFVESILDADGDRISSDIRIPTAIPSETYNGGAGNEWIMRISAETAGMPQGRDRGHLWIDSAGGRAVQWMFSVNTTRLPDGPLTLRYIVVDTAGNATLYQQNIIIQNEMPQIRRITLDTRDGGNRPVPGLTLESLQFASGANPEGFIDTGWTVRNRHLGFDVDTIYGNAPLNFRLQHVTRERVQLDAAGLDILRARRTAQGDNFIYLFTVDATGLAPIDAWNDLGYTGTSTPARGTHFVPSGLVDAAAMPGTHVWVYTQGAGPEVAGPLGYRGGVNPIPRLGFDEDDFRATQDDNAANRIPHFVLGETLSDADDEAERMANRPFFLIRVWDSVTATNPPTTAAGLATWTPTPSRVENEQLHAAAVLAMDVFLFDRVRPVATLHDLNPFLETGVAPGNNNTPASRSNTIRNALNPQSAGWDGGGNLLPANRNRGGLFNTNTTGAPARSGHIEPRSGSGIFTPAPPSWVNGFDPANRNPAHQSAFTVDHVSGRVILRGRATDNERIQRVELAITLADATPTEPANPGNNTNWFPILEWRAENETVGGEQVPVYRMRTVGRPADAVGANMAGYNLRVPPEGAAFSDVGVVESFDRVLGHAVEWSFLWDTELVTGGIPASNVRVSVRVTDGQGATATSSHVAQRNVNVVPYITGFERQARYRTIRSMQGWYSFYQGEQEIAALGWNLGNADTAPTLRLNHYTVAGRTTTALALNTAAEPTRTSNRVTFDMPANAVSGRIELSVGGTAFGDGSTRDHNHRANISQFWNMDDHLFGTRAALWNNRLYAHIWRTDDSDYPHTHMGPLANSVGLSHPGMALEFTGGALTGAGAGNNPASSHGRLHGAWSVFGTANVHYGRNDGLGVLNSATVTQINTGTPGEPLVNPDISMFHGRIDGGQNWPNVAYVLQNDGNPLVRIRPRVGVQGGGAEILGGSGTPTNRWQNIRVSNAAPNSATAAADPGRLFTTVYDTYNRSLVFVTRDGTTNTRVVIDGGAQDEEVLTAPDDGNLPQGTFVHDMSTAAGFGTITTPTGWFRMVSSAGTGGANAQTNTSRVVLTIPQHLRSYSVTFVVQTRRRTATGGINPAGSRNFTVHTGTVWDAGTGAPSSHGGATGTEISSYTITRPVPANGVISFVATRVAGGSGATGAGARDWEFRIASATFDMDINANTGIGILGRTIVTDGVTRSADAGLFSAVGFTGGGTAGGADPVVAYFDFANDSLRIATGTGVAPTGDDFERHWVLYEDHLLHRGSGRYVSMAIDTRAATPVIHLAFFNQRHGALVHTSATLTGTGTLTSRFGENARVVDNVNGVGRWTDISLDHWGNPWIVYAYNDRSGNFDGIRVAYLSRAGSTAGAADNMGTNVHFTRPNHCRVRGAAFSIAGWEAVQMAAPFRVAYDRLNIEAWPPSRHGVSAAAPTAAQVMASANRPSGGGTQGRAWGAAIGYASGSGDNRFRIGYFFWPNVTFEGQ